MEGQIQICLMPFMEKEKLNSEMFSCAMQSINIMYVNMVQSEKRGTGLPFHVYTIIIVLTICDPRQRFQAKIGNFEKSFFH